MKLNKTILVLLISLISIFPHSTEAQVLTSFNLPKPLTLGEVQQFIWEYHVRFVKMDFDAFIELFSREAVRKSDDTLFRHPRSLLEYDCL